MTTADFEQENVLLRERLKQLEERFKPQEVQTGPISFRQYMAERRFGYHCRFCKALKRKRLVEVTTLNPWNTNEDGSVKTFQEIKALAHRLLARRCQRFVDIGCCEACLFEMTDTEIAEWQQVCDEDICHHSQIKERREDNE